MLDIIKQKQLQARKSNDTVARNLLTTLLGEITTAQKNSIAFIDADISSIVVKFIKNAKEMANLQTDEQKRAVAIAEIDILQSLLPQQLTQDQLTQIINQIIVNESITKMGIVMKILKDRYNNQYDAQLASAIVKTKLS